MNALFLMTLWLSSEPVPAPEQVIVVANRVPVMAGDRTLATLPAGTVLDSDKTEGSWLLLPRYNAWIKSEAVLPLAAAEIRFTQLIAQRPSVEAYHHRGIVRSELGRLKDATADFDAALQIDPQAAHVLVNRGIVYNRRGDASSALVDFDAALQIVPRLALALANRGGVHLEQGNNDAALMDLDAALAIDPSLPEALNNRGVIRRLDGRYVEAIADYTQAIEANPRYAVAFANRGYALKQQGDWTAALADYERAQQLDPDNPASWNDAAWLLATCREESVRDPARAVEMAETARDRSPQPSGEILDTLAAAYASAGRFDDAIRTAEAALEVLPQSDRGETTLRLKEYRDGRPYHES